MDPNFKKLFKTPSMLVSRDFSLKVCNNNVGVARFGVVVAKKHIKKAVERNKAKRLARGIFKENQDSFINKDVVLMIKKIETASNLSVWKEKMRRVFGWLEHFIL